MTKITEDAIEQATLEWLENLGYEITYGPDIAFDGTSPERDEKANYTDVVLIGRLRSALERINSTLPADAIDEAVRKITRPENPSLIENNRAFQKMLTDGVDISWMGADGEKHDKAWLVDPANPDNNDWLAVNQFTVVEDNRERRPDIVMFVSGLPLAVIELKNAADGKATIQKFLPENKGDSYPLLSERRNIVVIADEAHRSQYDFIDCFAQAMEFILGLEDGKKRYLQAVTVLSKAFALAVPHEEALAIRDKVGLFQEIRASLVKATVSDSEKSPEEMETAIRQLVSRAVSSTEVVDIFAAAGLDKPDISILSDEFLAGVQQLPQRNLALELLKKLLNDEIKTRMRKNVVQARSFAEMLEEAINKYQNRAIEAAEVIEELIKLAKEMREAQKRGENLGLNDDEIAFYDALEVNDSAVQLLGGDTLKLIAQELVNSVKRSVSVDWTKRENARAQIRVMVKRILRKYGYPPDKQAKATELVLEQATVLCQEWTVE